MPLRLSDFSLKGVASGTTRARFTSSCRTPRPWRSHAIWAASENSRYAERSGRARTNRHPRAKIQSENRSRTSALLLLEGGEGLAADDKDALDDGHQARHRQQCEHDEQDHPRQAEPDQPGG